MNLLVVGAGTMGTGIAQVFAGSNNKVLLCDINKEYVEKGLVCIERTLSKLIENGKLTVETRERILSNIKITTELEEAADCSFAIEAVVEDINVKKVLFKKLDLILKPEAILATNTSSLSITELGSVVKRRDKMAGMHFFNPAPVMKLVEVISGPDTSAETIQKVKEIAASIGKQAVEVKEGPGFVVNRILIPMINEAIGILGEGLASVEDIDKAMMLGANHPLGPLSLADLIGNDICLAIMEVLYKETGDCKYRPHPKLKQMVRAGYLGKKVKRGFYTY